MDRSEQEQELRDLQVWVKRVGIELGIDRLPTDDQLRELLRIAGVTARGVMRPAAPVTAYLIGLLMADPQRDLSQISQKLMRMVESQGD